MPDRRILLIDDEPSVRDVVSHCLSRPGYLLDAPAVEDLLVAERAQQDALSGAYDILLLDLRLPNLDPIDILDQLTQVPTEPIAFAAFLPDEIRNDLRKHGCNRFVQKPFTFAELRAEIDAGRLASGCCFDQARSI